MKILLGFFIAIATVSTAFSQQYNFRSYSVGEGLAQSQVYTMCEDNQGYLWFGTRGGGLSKFDGIQFTNYTIQEGLSSNYIRTLFSDSQGILWIGTDQGLCSFNGSAFRKYGSKQGLFDETVNGITEDKDKVKWIATETGIFLMEKDTLFRFGRKSGVPMERVNCITDDSKGNIWAGTEKGLYRIFKKDQEYSFSVLTKKEGLPGNIINGLLEDSRQRLWICTYGGGLGCLANDTLKVWKMSDGLASNTVYDCAERKDGSFWFGTSNGVSRLVIENGVYEFRTFTEAEGLANNVVMSVMQDSFDNSWFGTSGGGISKLGSERFVHYTSIPGIFGNWVYAIAQDTSGNFWFGTSEGGVTRYDGKYYKRFSEKNGFTSSKVKAIHLDKDGNFWFGTVADGAYRYDGKSFRHYNIAKGLSSNFINSIASDSSGRIFMATAGGGISCLYPSGYGNYKVRHIKPVHGLPGDRVNVLLFDNGIILAGMAGGGIAKIIPPTDTTPAKINKYNSSKEIFSPVRSLVKRPDGVLFAGTADAGIVAYDGKRFISYTRNEGLSSNNIYSLLLDDSNNLWAGTEKGIDKIMLDNAQVLSVRHYGKPEGFVGIETIQNSVCKDRQGNLWFGSVKCATMYDPEKDKQPRPPVVRFTDIYIFFKDKRYFEFSKELKNLKLNHDQNYLSFEFIGIEHTNPESVNYKWMLEGFDKTWSPVSDKRAAVYSYLPPGSYTFKVMAANEAGQWSKEAAVFDFAITPPFWKTWWFYVVIYLTVIGVGAWLIRSRIKKVRAKNERERQQLEMEKNLVELEQKALRLQMNPHFLFNCLNSIKGLIAEGKLEESKVYLAKFSKLMRSILENSRASFITLENEITSLKNYGELEKLSQGDKLEVLIEVSPDIHPDIVEIPPMLVQPFVENAILHGLSPKQEKGWVKVSFAMEGRLLKCSIEDNGVGREEASRLKGNSLSAHKSSAIAITQERLNIINKNLNLGTMEIEVHDRISPAGKLDGTIVTLLIPYQNL